MLPLDTRVTVIPRQSKKAGAKHNIHSQELADHELIALATSHGFAPELVRLDKRDMGISANTTTIDERPALREWLREALPAGISKVVVFSQVDRAFRDEEEIELNRFIREVKRHRGWVICGHKVYRLWEEYDADMFRMEAKYAAKYIVHQVRGRLIPAIGRAAQRGLYDGRGLNVGYLVDYDPKSPTYKQFVPYRPHADLVLHEIFEHFAHMPYPSVPALVRAWNTSNGMAPVKDPTTGELRTVPTLYFPALPPETDQRIWNRLSWGRRKVFPPYGIDDPLRRGWLLREQGARRILSNVFYLGWVARDGLILRGTRMEDSRVRTDPRAEPLVLHEPIVADPNLFWYCFNLVSPYTIDGAPNPKRRFYTKGPRQDQNEAQEPRVTNARATAIRNAESNTLLLLGKVRCGVHGLTFMRHRRKPTELDYYVCKFQDPVLGHRQSYCTYLRGEEVDCAVVNDFLSRLQLTADDEHSIAQAWQAQQRKVEAGAMTPPVTLHRAEEIEGELANLALGIAHTSVESVRERLVGEMEKLTVELTQIRSQMEAHQRVMTRRVDDQLSPQALRAARESRRLLDELRHKWHCASLASRQALMQWIVDKVTLTSVEDDRRLVEGRVTWRGGQRTALRMIREHDRRQAWDARELEVLRTWYPSARWEDLYALLPGRAKWSIIMAACRHGVAARSRHAFQWQAIQPSEMRRLTPSSMSMRESVQVVESTRVPPPQWDGGTLLELSVLLGRSVDAV
jgi:hypothetical protein